MFVAWFTFDDTVGKVGSPDNRWLVAQGNYTGDTATLQMFQISGGVFDNPQAVQAVPNGTLIVSFSDCQTGLVDYDLPDDGLTGQIEIARAVPGTEALCQSLIAAKKNATPAPAGQATEPVSLPDDQASASTPIVKPAGGGFEINQGISGSWFNPSTSGQGFLFDVDPVTNFIFMAWFTFESGANAKVGAPEQRWLVAQGNYTGNLADLVLFAISGGLFDDPQGIVPAEVGSVTLVFPDCENGIVEYDFPDEGLTGQIEIVRAVPGTQNLCQSLVSGKQKQ